MPIFYSTVDSASLRDYMPAAPIMLTATSFWLWERDPHHIKPPRVPEHVWEVAADSGGFVAAMRHGGRYPFTFEAYVAWLYTIPRLSWAALPDLPVERELAQTYANMRQRQELTLRYAAELWGQGSAAWNQRFGPKLELQKQSGLTQRQYAWTVAWPDYRRKIDRALGGRHPSGRQQLLV